MVLVCLILFINKITIIENNQQRIIGTSINTNNPCKLDNLTELTLQCEFIDASYVKSDAMRRLIKNVEAHVNSNNSPVAFIVANSNTTFDITHFYWLIRFKIMAFYEVQFSLLNSYLIRNNVHNFFQNITENFHFEKSIGAASMLELISLFKNLKVLFIKSVSLTGFPARWILSFPKSIQSLTLSNNNLSYLWEIYNFNSLVHLRYLNITYNLIQYIASNAFDSMPNLTLVNFKGNDLKILFADQFYHNYNLEFIILSENNELNVTDFAFDRNVTDNSSVIHYKIIDLNGTKKFDPCRFCSRNKENKIIVDQLIDANTIFKIPKEKYACNKTCN